MQPDPAFIVYPGRDTSSKRSTHYLQPMSIKSHGNGPCSPVFRDDMARLRIKLQTMLVYMG